MLKEIDTSEVISRYLNKYCLDNIWNTPETEYRQNFIARCVSAVPQMGSVRLGPISLYLPTNDAFYVYELPKCCMGNLNIKVPTWTKMDAYLNTNPFDFRVTGVDGQWLWRNGIYIIDYPCQCSLVMVIEASMARKILGNNYNFKKIYVSVYVDSDGEPLTNMQIECRRPTNIETRNQAWDLCKLADIIFINGRESQPTSVNDVLVGDYIELIDDPDIVSDFTVDLSVVGESRIYRSTIDACFKYIAHIPKKDNPDNYLITHNTCDVFIRPKPVNDYANARLKGLFMHRFNTNRAISQLTHNDFSISEILLNAYMDALGTTEIILRVVARKHKKNLKLVRESNYIGMLYQLTDNEILDFMTGAGDPTLPFWRADHLEQSRYIKLMFDNPIFTGINSLSGYIDALGYYNTMALLTKRITRTTIGPNTTHVFTVDLPITMIPLQYVDAHLFLNGVKINNRYYNARKYAQYVTIAVDPSIPLPPGTEVVTELFETSKFKAEYITPSATANRLTVDDQFEVYQVREAVDDQPQSNYFADKYSVDQTYELVPENKIDTTYELIDNNNGTATLQFKDVVYGNTYLVCTKRVFARCFSKDFTLGELYGQSISTGPLMLKATQWSDGAVLNIPMIKTITPIVYLNGRELVENVDFTYVQNKSMLGNIASRVVHIENSQYLKSGTNINSLEVYVTTDKCFSQEDGFVTNGFLTSLNVLLYWYQELAMLTCDGIAIRDLQYQDGMLKLPSSVRNGAIYYVRAMVAENVKKLLDQYGSDMDTERCIAILNYFRGRNPVDNEFVIIPHSHHIYSIIVNEIMKDVINGDFTLVYDADLARMRDQVEKYLTAADQDSTLAGVMNDIIVAGAGIQKVNQTYRPADKTAKGQARRWYNGFSNLAIWYNEEIQHWEIVSTLVSIKGVYYYAEDVTNGLADPSNLVWKTGDLGVDNPPVLETGMLNLTFIDILSSYRLYDSETPEFYNTLEQLKRALLPMDPNRDVRVDQP